MVTAHTQEHRLHPITLVQRVILSLPGLVILLLTTWQSPDEGNLASLVVTILYAVVALPIIYLRYARFRYWITDTELVIHSGVLTRQHRNIPLDKIQNVEIVQRLLPRLTGTAQVQVVTAGSSAAEGVLQFVSLEEANRIREIVRSYNRLENRANGPADANPESANQGGELPELRSRLASAPRLSLYAMSIGRVLLSGVFRFSLLYIALIFSALQFFQPDPDKLADWIMRSRFEPVLEAMRASPFTSAVLAIIGAAALSWLSGIIVNLNKFFAFKLWKEGSKIGRRSGLLTVTEGSIPLKKIQALVVRTNPVMSAAGWSSLHVQTMGLDDNDSGHRVVVPFARTGETDEIAHSILDFDAIPAFIHVSQKRIMRLFVRYTLLLLALIATIRIWYPSIVWAVFVVPALFGTAYLQWKHHLYAVTDQMLAVKRGVINRRTWMLPLAKAQVFYATESFFQRRRGLRSVYVDSAGASSISRPVVIDVDREVANSLTNALYSRFKLATRSLDQASSGPSDRS